MRQALAVAVLGLLVLATGCDSGPRTVTVAATAGAAVLQTGDHLRVDLGRNDPIGDAVWFLLEEPDPAILTDNGSNFESNCDRNVCEGRDYWEFTAAGTGFETLSFRQCLNGTVPPACEFDEIPLSVSVRVQ
jgi:hypothetical protein